MSVMRVDFEKLRLTLLPHCLRQGALLEALFHAAYVPLHRVYDTFAAYVGKEERERAYGPTVRQLRQAIADHLGITDGSLVRFHDVQNRDVADLRRQADAASTRLPLGPAAIALWSDNMVWWNREFTVSLPQSYDSADIEAEVRTILDRWKMAASRYTISYY